MRWDRLSHEDEDHIPQTSDKWFDFSLTTPLPPMSRGSLTWTLRQRASLPEWAEWSTASEVYGGKFLQSTMYGTKFISKHVKNLCFWLFSHWYGRLGRNIGGVLSTPETSNKVSKLQPVTSECRELFSRGEKTVTSKDVYSEAMIEPGLRIYWNSIENFLSSEKQQSGAVIFWEKEIKVIRQEHLFNASSKNES